jgi:hypothetical protein
LLAIAFDGEIDGGIGYFYELGEKWVSEDTFWAGVVAECSAHVLGDFEKLDNADETEIIDLTGFLERLTTIRMMRSPLKYLRSSPSDRKPGR